MATGLDSIPRYRSYTINEKNMDQKLTIGRVAKHGGVNIQTVRYYERRGILNPNG
jgi:hypothetical protein